MYHRTAQTTTGTSAKKSPRLAVGITLGLLALGGIVAYGSSMDRHEQATAAPAPVAQTVQVTYEADGEATTYSNDGGDFKVDHAGRGSVTMSTPGGGVSQKNDVDLPMQLVDASAPGLPVAFTPGERVYLSVQNSKDNGHVTCRIKASDGTIIAENTSQGGYAIATCTGVAR